MHEFNPTNAAVIELLFISIESLSSKLEGGEEREGEGDFDDFFTRRIEVQPSLIGRESDDEDLGDDVKETKKLL